MSFTEKQFADRCTRVFSDLYVAEVACVGEVNRLRRLRIGSICSILTQEHLQKYARYIDPVTNSPHFLHQVFKYGDNDIIEPAALHGIINWIAAHEGPTLVHCVSGANRSTCVSLAYLINEHRLDPMRAFHRYITTRGEAIAEVYGAVPKMSSVMLENLINWYAWRHRDHV